MRGDSNDTPTFYESFSSNNRINRPSALDNNLFCSDLSRKAGQHKFLGKMHNFVAQLNSEHLNEQRERNFHLNALLICDWLRVEHNFWNI